MAPSLWSLGTCWLCAVDIYRIDPIAWVQHGKFNAVAHEATATVRDFIKPCYVRLAHDGATEIAI